MKRSSTRRTRVWKWLGVLMLVVVAIFAAQVPLVKAQCGGNITPEEWIYGSISRYGTRQCNYTFYGRVGDYVSIKMERDKYSPRLDPYLQLRDPFDRIVDWDDDSLGNRNSWIEGYRIRRSGWYTIGAGSYNNATYGQFWLYLSKY